MGCSPPEIQGVLDRISDEVCASLPPDDIIAHTNVVYEETAQAYAGNSEHDNIPDALLTFMNYFTGDAHILDVGCGSGRDAVFMALQDAELRKEFMHRLKDGKTALERFGMPRGSFDVCGIDASISMLRAADALVARCGFTPNDNGFLPVEFRATQDDMHMLWESTHMARVFDGVWSSAALFMHTPEPFIRSALGGVAYVLGLQGIFAVSYAHNASGLPYNNLRYSRTGEIKYFSRPTKEQIVKSAADVGLVLIHESFSDLEMAGQVKKDFFVNQIFQKV